MDPLPRLGGVALAVLDAPEMLAEEDATQLSAFLRAVARARDAYAQPIARGELWDRPPVPFHVVLGCGEEQQTDLLARLAAAGAVGLIEEAEWGLARS